MKKEIKHVNLKEIKDPSFLKDMSYEELGVLSSDIASYLVDVTSHNGGHLSSNLGVIDATIALCRVFDFSKDKIIFDVGHQSYTYKLLTGRDISSIRLKDGISGFQKKNESPYDHYECGHSSTSIGAALGMAISRDHKKEKYEVISFIGDSSITNGVSLEAINEAGNHAKNKIIVILNDNDMSISHSVGGLSRVFRNISVSTFYVKSRKLFKRIMSKTKFGRAIYRSAKRFKNWIKRLLIRTTFLDNMGFAIVGPVDGHDIKAMEKCLKKVKANDSSTIMIIKTIKGKGYKYAEEDKEGKWHGVPPFDKDSGEFKKSDDDSWSKYYASLIEKKMKEDENTFTIVPGTGYGSGLSPLFDIYPDRMIDVGIAEEHAFILASGLAVNGIHPNIVIYSTFLQRAYDELSHDLARMNLDATILVDRAGLVGADGETHQGLYDEAFLASIPHVTITMASNDNEGEELYRLSYQNHGPFVIRFPKDRLEVSDNKYHLEYGKWRKEIEGKDTALISLGPIIKYLKKAIQEKKLNCTLYNAIFINPLDIDALNDINNNYQKVIIYDPYGTENGLASLIAKKLIKLGYQGKTIIKTLPNEYITHGNVKEQLMSLNLDIESVLKEI